MHGSRGTATICFAGKVSTAFCGRKAKVIAYQIYSVTHRKCQFIDTHAIGFIFQQDSAPAHAARHTRQVANVTTSLRWTNDRRTHHCLTVTSGFHARSLPQAAEKSHQQNRETWDHTVEELDLPQKPVANALQTYSKPLQCL